MNQDTELYDSIVAAYEKVVAAEAEPNMIVVDVGAGMRRLMWLGYAEAKAREFIQANLAKPIA